MKQHTQPCKECPFRRVSLPGYLGGNDPKSFAFHANTDGPFPCHIAMRRAPKNPAQCAGRAVMWTNQCKKSRDNSVPRLERDTEKVFGHIGQFNKHHNIDISPEELMFGVPMTEGEL